MEVAFTTSAFQHVVESGGRCFVWLEDVSGSFSSLSIATSHPPGAIEFRVEKAWRPSEPFADDGIDLHLDESLDVPYLAIALRRFPRRRLDVTWSQERPKATDFLIAWVP